MDLAVYSVTKQRGISSICAGTDSNSTEADEAEIKARQAVGCFFVMENTILPKMKTLR